MTVVKLTTQSLIVEILWQSCWFEQ